MSNNFPAEQGPLLKIVSKGLNIWVSSKCKVVGELKIELKGSFFQLIKGKVDGVTLNAKKLIFQKISFDSVDLVSRSLTFKLNLSNASEIVSLQNKFKIEGTVSIKGDDLNQLLLSSEWQWLSDSLAENLIGITPLSSCLIGGEKIELQTKVIGNDQLAKSRFIVSTENGHLKIQTENKQVQYTVPMDPSIYIEDAFIRGARLYLKGFASVKP